MDVLNIRMFKLNIFNLDPFFGYHGVVCIL